MDTTVDYAKEYKEKYKRELDLLNKYIKNDYIYDIILNYRTIRDGEIIKLSANINVYEMVFLANLLRANNSKNVLEIGCANGVSGMVIMNQLIKNGGGSLISVDPNQFFQWYNVGKYNINKIIENNENKNISVTHEIIENTSDHVLSNFVKTGKRFDAIFIDGSHGFKDVIIDIFCSIKILKKGGLMILDDVLHTGVKLVVDELVNFRNLKKVEIAKDAIKITNSNYHYKTKEKSHRNPPTMYAYMKI